MRIISPSILNADFSKLGLAIEMLNSSKADWIHLDVMDGVFVPNLSFGTPIIEAVNKISKKPLDIHLMIVDPDRYIDHYQRLGASYLTVHYEVCPHLHRTLSYIKSKGMKAGVSLNPHTPIELLEDIINDCDMVLLMSVNPGFGGQSFISNTFEKVKRLKQLILKHKSAALIQVDGGVDVKNIAELNQAGVDSFVVGSAIFKAENPLIYIEQLKSI